MRNYAGHVSLVESLAFSPDVVDALREAFAAGTGHEPFTFGDYYTIRRRFRERDVPVGPTIALDALASEDLEDGQEG